MVGVNGLLGKGIFLVFALGLASMLAAYLVVDATHKTQLENEFAKIKRYHQQTTQKLMNQRLEQLTLVAEEIYLLGEWENENITTVSPALEKLWPKVEFTFALSAMVLKQQEQEIVFGSIDEKLLTDLYDKTMLSLRPQSQFICRPRCSLVAIVPIFLDNKKAALFVSSDVAPMVSYIHSVLTSDMAVMTDVTSVNGDLSQLAIDTGNMIYSPSVDTNTEQSKAIFTDFESRFASKDAVFPALKKGQQLLVGERHVFTWLTAIENDTDKFQILFTTNVDDLLFQQRQQEQNFLIIIGSIALSILAIISILSFRPIQRLGKLRQTMALIGDKQYSAATEALGLVKNGRSKDEINALEREFKQSIYQLMEYENQLQESQQRLTLMATIDVTTKLLNRNAFLEDMKALQPDFCENKTTLLFLDLDGFKSVNDILGHVVGDMLLEQVGKRLNQLSDDQINVYRIGGDEFLVAIKKLECVPDIDIFCDQIVHIFDQAFSVENQNINVTASIGVAFANEQTISHIELLKQADIAMYQAKKSGKNQYCFFTDMMMEQINLRYIINSQFEAALADNQLSLVYQPIVDANNGKLIKLEALSRWQHPDLGFIRPDIFIAVIEETPHINELSQWLISQAANKVNELDALGLNDVLVSINISGAQVTDINSIGQLMVECSKANVEYNRIELEITETSLISDFKKAQDWITKVNKMGFRIAIDDFGTGYSSLSYLTAFPFDCVKLDRSLLLDVEENERTRNIVRAITNMIHSLDVPVVAEGIETLNHLEVIKSLECDYVQGYYFSKPLATQALKDSLLDYIERGEWQAET